MAPVSLGEVVGRARQIPDRYRRYTADVEKACNYLGANSELVVRLLDAGFPHRSIGAEVFFDELDLENCGLSLELSTPQWKVLQTWKKSLRHPAEFENKVCRVRASWGCPSPGHVGACDYSVTEYLTRVVVDAPNLPSSAGTALALTAKVSTDRYRFAEPMNEIIGRALELRFHKLPEPLTGDEGFLRETGLADCRLANSALAGLARAHGLPARVASGYFLGIPFAAPHAWLEVRIEGRWMAADPFYLNTLHTWGVLDPEAWPVTDSPRFLLWRTGAVGLDAKDFQAPLVKHAGDAVAVNVLTRWS